MLSQSNGNGTMLRVMAELGFDVVEAQSVAEAAGLNLWESSLAPPFPFQPIYAGRLTDEGFYPARVCSGREKLGE